MGGEGEVVAKNWRAPIVRKKKRALQGPCPPPLPAPLARPATSGGLGRVDHAVGVLFQIRAGAGRARPPRPAASRVTHPISHSLPTPVFFPSHRHSLETTSPVLPPTPPHLNPMSSLPTSSTAAAARPGAAAAGLAAGRGDPPSRSAAAAAKAKASGAAAVGCLSNQCAGFRDFIMRGNVIDLAVAIVVGAAFTELIKCVGGKGRRREREREGRGTGAGRERASISGVRAEECAL